MNFRYMRISRYSATIPIIALAALILAACATGRDRAEPAATRPVSDPAAPQPVSGRVYQVDPEASRLRIRVDPDGALANLGHVHIIGGPALGGTVTIAPDRHDSRLDLVVDAGALLVDRHEWRRQEGLERDPDASAIEATRDNMLGPRVLDAENHPEVRIVGVAVSGPDWQPDITVQIHLRGLVRELTVPVALVLDDDRLVATGMLALRQSEFGIQPFAAGGGALRVADRVIVRFRIVAYPEPSP